MAVKFANNVSTTLSTAINATQTTISVADASGLPTLSSGDYIYLTIDTDTISPTIEVVKVTGVSTNTLTVVRGQDGTTASSFSSGVKVELRVTAAALDDISSAADTESVSISGDTMTGTLTAPTIAGDDLVLREWTGNSSYSSLAHKDQSGAEYMIISADDHTYISATAGYDVKIRGGNNVNTYEVTVYPDQDATASGNKIWHAGDFTSTNVSNWNTAYGWGDHSTQGYLTAEADTLATVTGRGATTTNAISTGGITTSGALDFTANPAYIRNDQDNSAQLIVSAKNSSGTAKQVRWDVANNSNGAWRPEVTNVSALGLTNRIWNTLYVNEIRIGSGNNQLVDSSRNITAGTIASGAITASGDINIGSTVSGLIINRSSARTRKIVLYDAALGNDFQFYGFGVESQSFINSIYATSDTFYWYAGVNATTRQLAGSLSGTGNATFAGTISSGSVTAGDSSTAASIRAHYNDGSYMTLEGYGLSMNRGASYIRPTTDGDKTLYIGGADDSLDWDQIHFRSLNGLYMTGTRFLTTGRDLQNIASIAVDGNVKLNGNYPVGVDNVVLGEGAGASVGTGAQDNVLIGDLAGNQLSSGDYNTCVGSNAGSAYTTHTNSVAIGNRAGVASTQTSQVLVGSKSGSTDPAFASTAVGFESLMMGESTGYRVTGLGYRAFRNNTTGQNNTGVGYQAGASNTTTSNNTYVGTYAGDGTAVGGGYNTAVGAYSLTSNLVTGSGYNTCVGGRSGLSVTSGSDNTLIGYGAGDSVSSGFDNTAVGYNALQAINTENGNVAVGHNALGSAYSTIESTCVGSGAGSTITTGSKNTILGAYSGNEDGLDIRTLSNRIVLADGDGSVGLYIDDSQDAHFDGNVIAYSTTISDRRLKSEITNISNALDKVGQINGVTFVRNNNGEKAAGIVAQEIMEVLPEAVKSQVLPLQTGEQDKEYYVVEYDAVTGLLVEAVKELKARVEALESK